MSDRERTDKKKQRWNELGWGQEHNRLRCGMLKKEECLFLMMVRKRRIEERNFEVEGREMKRVYSKCLMILAKQELRLCTCGRVERKEVAGSFRSVEKLNMQWGML